MIDGFIYIDLLLSVSKTTIGRKYFNNNTQKQIISIISSCK